MGHSLALERTILRDVIRDGSGTWITDCTTYLHNVDRPNRDMFLSAKARNVASMVVVAMPSTPPAASPPMGIYLTSSTPLTVLLLQVSLGLPACLLPLPAAASVSRRLTVTLDDTGVPPCDILR
jgi:hypothetical protein